MKAIVTYYDKNRELGEKTFELDEYNNIMYEEVDLINAIKKDSDIDTVTYIDYIEEDEE